MKQFLYMLFFATLFACAFHYLERIWGLSNACGTFAAISGVLSTRISILEKQDD